MTPLTPTIVIGIPTYKRPALLERLLQSLAGELRSDVAIVVADNECSDAARAVVDAFRDRWPSTHYRPVAARGIANVRNALVDAADELAPRWRWLVMLDDDGEVTAGWFEALLRTAEATNAHAVGGAIVCPLPEGAGVFARNSEFALRERRPSGVVDLLGIAQNICLSGALRDLVARPWFDSAYGLSGGEDYDFFRRVQKAGGTFAWCDEAVVIEAQPPERLLPRAVLYRSLTTGVSSARIDARHDGSVSTWRKTAWLMCCALGGVTVYGVLLRRNDVVRALIGVAYVTGRVLSFTRVFGNRYEKVGA